MVSKKPNLSRKKSETHPEKPAHKPAEKRAHSGKETANSSKRATAARSGAETEEEGKGGSMRPDEMPAEVVEFIQAIDEYKRIHCRPFPSWSEVLEVLKALGYERAA